MEPPESSAVTQHQLRAETTSWPSYEDESKEGEYRYERLNDCQSDLLDATPQRLEVQSSEELSALPVSPLHRAKVPEILPQLRCPGDTSSLHDNILIDEALNRLSLFTSYLTIDTTKFTTRHSPCCPTVQCGFIAIFEKLHRIYEMHSCTQFMRSRQWIRILRQLIPRQ